MGLTTSCRAPCFQCAIAPLDGSLAMRTGAVLSTRAISTFAGRRSEAELSSACACGAGGKPLCEGSRICEVLPIILWLLLIAFSFRSAVRIFTGRREFYARQESASFLKRPCFVRTCSKRARAFTNARWAGRCAVDALNGDRARGIKIG